MSKTVNELTKARLDALFELKEWQKLLIHFDLAPDSFAFIPVIVPDASWAEVCRTALSDFLKTSENKRLLDITVKTPDELRNLASTIFDLKPMKNTGAVWICAPKSFRQKDADEWQSAWREGMARLNQYRNPFREKFDLPVLLVGAERLKELTRDMAPDLWSVMIILVTINPPIITRDTGKTRSLAERFPDYEDHYGIDPYFALEEAAKLRGQKGKEETLARILNRAINGLIAKGKYREVIEISEELKDILKSLIRNKKSTEFEIFYATALSNEGVALNRLGKYDEAIELYKQALLIDEKTIGKEHSEYAIHLNNLALVYKSQRRYDEAVELYKQVLLIDEKTIGKEHPRYANHLNNLANVYQGQGRYDEAVKLFNQSLLIGEQTVGKEHPDYAIRLNNLANVYQGQGRYDEAIELYKQAILIDEKAIGKEHPQYATDLNNLACVYFSQKKFRKALDLFEESLRINEKTLPEDHTYIAQDRESVEMCRRMLEEDRKAK